MPAPRRARGWDVTIVSSDKDLMQLVGPDGNGGHIDMLDTMKNQRIDIPEVEEKFGVAPGMVGDVLALMGDSARTMCPASAASARRPRPS